MRHSRAKPSSVCHNFSWCPNPAILCVSCRSGKTAKRRRFVFYLAQGYENLLDGPKAMEAIQRLGVLAPEPSPGQPPSHRQLMYEKHLRRIQYLVKDRAFAGELIL